MAFIATSPDFGNWVTSHILTQARVKDVTVFAAASLQDSLTSSIKRKMSRQMFGKISKTESKER